MSRGDLEQTEANCRVREGILLLREDNATQAKRRIEEGIALAQNALDKLLSSDPGLRDIWCGVKSLIDVRIPFNPAEGFYKCIRSCVDYKVLREYTNKAEMEPWCTLASRYNTVGHACIMYSYWGGRFEFSGAGNMLCEAKRAMHYAVQLLYPTTAEKLWRQIEVNCGVVLLADGLCPVAKALFAEAASFFKQSDDKANEEAAGFWVLEAERVCPGECAEIPFSSPRSY